MASDKSNPAESPQGRQFLILCVEDNEISKLIMLRALRDVGEIVTASSVETALQVLLQRSFDLVITDFRLPDKNGIELIHHIRRRWKGEELPILMISSSMDRELRQDAILAGANDCAAKPIDRMQLLALVDKLIATHYKQQPDPLVIRYTQVRWEQDGNICIFCPELGIEVKEATLELAQNAIESAIMQNCKGGELLPSIGTPVVRRLTLHSPSGRGLGSPS